MDSSFLQHQVVWIGAGTHLHMAALAPGELLRLTGAATFDPEAGS
jgi:prolyl-tRNA editing enzyme YbaK/EbsC (Cys-tRNA(Pro) deacylase)